MTRSSKTALSEASSSGAIQKTEVSDDFLRSFFSKSRKSSWGILIGTLVAFAVAVLIAWLLISKARIIIFSAKIVIFFLLCLIAPIYGVYNIFTTASAIRKRDCEFYYGTYRGEKDDHSAIVNGLEDQTLHFSDNKECDLDPAPGCRVIIARLNDDLSLFRDTSGQ
ncbi:MAG: hypothetical protein J5379_05410 [Clostridiales bacterium]|nr:hypothetical protein [Clostridiales bacterium]